MNPSDNVAVWKWPKRHAHTVEECRLLDVRDFLAELDPLYHRYLTVWCPLPEQPWLRLVRHDAGRIRRWWFVCPRCNRRCETLHRPPEASSEYDWRCRTCWGLIYASQRYGRRHALRRVLTPRKRATQWRRAVAARRRTVRARARWEREEARRAARSSKRASTIPAFTEMPMKSDEVLVIEVPASAVRNPPSSEWPGTVRCVSKAQLAAEEAAKHAKEAALAAQWEALRAKYLAGVRDLAKNAPRKRDRERAKRLLVKHGYGSDE